MNTLIFITISILYPLFASELSYSHSFSTTIQSNLFLLFHPPLFQIIFLNQHDQKLNITHHQRTQKSYKIITKNHEKDLINIQCPFYFMQPKREHVYHYIHPHVDKPHFTISLIAFYSSHQKHQTQISPPKLLSSKFSLKENLFQPQKHPKFAILRTFHLLRLFSIHNHIQLYALDVLRDSNQSNKNLGFRFSPLHCHL